MSRPLLKWCRWSDILHFSGLQDALHKNEVPISSVNVTKSEENCEFGHIY